MTRLPVYDPRTVARDIPGIFDCIFPQLTPGVVAHFNRTATNTNCQAVPEALIQKSTLQKSMLFELASACGEQQLRSEPLDWQKNLEVAVARQQKHFDARIPSTVTQVDQEIACAVGHNLSSILNRLAQDRRGEIVIAPIVPGFQWVASGNADFGIGKTLIEVKCGGKNFSASDYRQIVMYWLLSFAASLETNSAEWEEAILLNPRAARIVTFPFDEVLHVISAGRTKVEILQLFSSMIGTRA